ncbi:hypothetical protein K488DRAFT_90562 [Vararia minispora EC-137]|uniref:Uncharacterized protein n=1 Tax=Vararia minispora EC-137 TaxID=1314806 RepID=A0ACB8Q7Z2_9AGAM|nr:hypothetical protein K488DRAFT_90562 [Vararia minispora EC-137]
MQRTPSEPLNTRPAAEETIPAASEVDFAIDPALLAVSAKDGPPAGFTGALNWRTTIHILSDDILLELFMHMAAIHETGWLCVIRVCRRWRIIAFSASSFWADRILDILSPEPVQMAVKYARGLPLSILTRDARSFPVDKDVSRALLGVISPLLPRVRSMDITFSSSDAADEFAQTIRFAGLPLLESLSLACTDVVFKGGWVMNNRIPVVLMEDKTTSSHIDSPSLRAIRLFNFVLPWQPQALTHLEISLEHPVQGVGFRVSLEKFYTLLSLSPRLEYMSISNWCPWETWPKAIPHLPRPRTEAISLPSLRFLAFRGVDWSTLISLLTCLKCSPQFRAALSCSYEDLGPLEETLCLLNRMFSGRMASGLCIEDPTTKGAWQYKTTIFERRTDDIVPPNVLFSHAAQLADRTNLMGEDQFLLYLDLKRAYRDHHNVTGLVSRALPNIFQMSEMKTVVIDPRGREKAYIPRDDEDEDEEGRWRTIMDKMPTTVGILHLRDVATVGIEEAYHRRVPSSDVQGSMLPELALPDAQEYD